MRFRPTEKNISQRDVDDQGFSLLEMMVVVVILGILAALANNAYGKWIGRARKAEAASMLAEMSAKEQVYLMEFGAYHPLRADGSTVLPSPNEGVDAFYPGSPSAVGFNSTRVAVTISNPAGWPAGWRNIGLRPKRSETYCTYLLNAGPAGTAVPAGSTVGLSLLPSAGDTATAWFYALAACNFSDVSGFPAAVTILALTHNSNVLRTLNDGM